MFECFYEGLGVESSLLFWWFHSHMSSVPSPFLRWGSFSPAFRQRPLWQVILSACHPLCQFMMWVNSPLIQFRNWCKTWCLKEKVYLTYSVNDGRSISEMTDDQIIHIPTLSYYSLWQSIMIICRQDVKLLNEFVCVHCVYQHLCHYPWELVFMTALLSPAGDFNTVLGAETPHSWMSAPWRALYTKLCDCCWFLIIPATYLHSPGFPSV